MNVDEFHDYQIKLLAKLKALKKPFDGLKNYSDKLKFWEEQGLDWYIGNYFFGENDDAEERAKPENRISIYTENQDEVLLLNKWRLEQVQKLPINNLKEQKAICLEKISDNPQALEFLKQEIESKTKYLETAKELERKSELSQNPEYRGWLKGFQSVVKKDGSALQLPSVQFLNIVRHYARGLMDAELIPFLEKERDKLEIQKKKTEIREYNPDSFDSSIISFKLKSGTIKKGEHRDILDVLKKGKLVNSETTLANFKTIFSGSNVKNKVHWIASVSALRAFVSGIWKFQANKKGKLKITLNCFTHKNELTEAKLKNNKGAKRSDMETINKALRYFTTT